MRIGPALAFFLGLCAGVGAPAGAQTTAPSGGPDEGIRAKLSAAGTVQLEELNGRLVRAETKSGNSITLILAASDRRQSIDDRINGNLANAGFRKIEVERDAKLVSGRLPGEQRVLAFHGSAAVTTGLAQNLLGKSDELRRELDRIGLSGYSEFRTNFFSTRTGSRRIFVLVGPKQFDDNKQVDLSAIALDRFSDNGFSYAGLTRKITVVRGRLGSMEVTVLVGPQLTSPDQDGE